MQEQIVAHNINESNKVRAIPRLLITLGDPCGIGPELLTKTIHILKRSSNIKVIGAKAGLDLLGGSRAEELLNCIDWVDPTPDISVNLAGAVAGN